MGSTGALAVTQRSVPAYPTCDQSLLRTIPQRSAIAPTGSEFARQVQNLSGLYRDALVRAQLLSGNIPDFLRRLAPVTIRGTDGSQPVEITVCVLPDYLAVGSNSDFVFIPMGLEAALQVGRHFGFGLPTPKLVDAIYEASVIKLEPLPLPATDQMRSTAYFVHHSELITRQREVLSAPWGELASGHKKDLVLTSRLWQVPGRVAIYGWHRAAQQPIQPLSTVHGARYADYSHGVRLISSTVYVNGVKRAIDDVLAEPTLGRLLSNEGPLRQATVQLNRLMGRLAEDSSAQAAWLPRRPAQGSPY